MANKTQKPGNTNTGTDQKLGKKKAFEQGTGNNNTTADDSKLKDNPELRNQNDMDHRDVDRRENRDQSKITNQDRKITNQDQPVKNKKSEHIPMDDDSDVVSQDDDSDVISQKNDPEIDPPHNEPERTEKKLPQMKK